MKIRLGPAKSKRLLVAIFAILLVAPVQVQSDQIAQGAVQVTITAYTNGIAVTGATCSLGIGTFDLNGNGAFSTSGSVAAAIQGGTITCVVTTPYYWSLSSLSGSITISYSVEAQNTNTLVNKSTSGGFPSIPVSTTGTITRNVVTML
jgi:hypothetical protein